MNTEVKGLLWLALGLAIAFLCAMGLSGAAKFIPWSIETRLAQTFGSMSEFETCALSKPSKILFERLTARLFPLDADDALLPITFTLLKGDTVNAFATLGGKIFVFEGLLKQAESPDEIAGILAHEIEHVKRRHIFQSVIVRLLTVESLKLVFGNVGSGSELANMLLSMKFGRVQESEADIGGLKRLHLANISTSGMQRFFERLENQASLPAILSDHPSNPDRIKMISKNLTEKNSPIMTREEFKAFQNACTTI